MSGDAGRPRFTGRQFLAWMLGAFAFVLLGNLALVYAALTTNPSEVPHGGPPAGLRMMQVRSVDANDPGWGLTITLSDRSLHLLSDGPDNLEITAALMRPDHSADNRSPTFRQTSPTGWTADINDLPKGRWLIEVTLRDTGTGQRAVRRGTIEIS